MSCVNIVVWSYLFISFFLRSENTVFYYWIFCRMASLFCVKINETEKALSNCFNTGYDKGFHEPPLCRTSAFVLVILHVVADKDKSIVICYLLNPMWFIMDFQYMPVAFDLWLLHFESKNYHLARFEPKHFSRRLIVKCLCRIQLRGVQSSSGSPNKNWESDNVFCSSWKFLMYL